MPILDLNLQFDPAATAITSTANSTNEIDLLNSRDIGVGTPLIAAVSITTTLASGGGSATLTVQLEGAPNNGGVAGTYVILAQTDALPEADLTAPQMIQVPWPIKNDEFAANSFYRFLRLRYVVASGPFTSGAIQANMMQGYQFDDVQSAYPSGFTVNN